MTLDAWPFLPGLPLLSSTRGNRCQKFPPLEALLFYLWRLALRQQQICRCPPLEFRHSEGAQQRSQHGPACVYVRRPVTLGALLSCSCVDASEKSLLFRSDESLHPQGWVYADNANRSRANPPFELACIFNGFGIVPAIPILANDCHPAEHVLV